jgi:hypothetical protein
MELMANDEVVFSSDNYRDVYYFHNALQMLKATSILVAYPLAMLQTRTSWGWESILYLILHQS